MDPEEPARTVATCCSCPVLKGNSQGIDEGKGLHKVLDPTGKYKFIGEQPFEVDQLGPGADPAGADRRDLEEPEDRRRSFPTSVRRSSPRYRCSKRAAAPSLRW